MRKALIDTKALRLASFGLRGYVGDTMDPRVVIDFAAAFATVKEGGKILLGRDTRYSSPMLHSAVISGLLSAGCEVLDFGICPTPLLQFSVPAYEAQGAVSISGGHHGRGWNTVMLISSDGSYLEPIGGETLLDIFHAGDFLEQDWQNLGHVRNIEDCSTAYFDALEGILDTERIQASNFTVLIDPVGGAGCNYLEPFAQRFGLNLIPINNEPTGYLAREPEPRPRSAAQMASTIHYLQADVGFVLDSDMSRMSLVSEVGEPASEECTFAVIANHFLTKQSGTIVTNCCTTGMIDFIAKRLDVPIVKSRVGQAYIVSALADEEGVIGGEGSGGVCVPAFSPAFDGFLMMGLVLEAMAQTGSTLSQLLQALPRCHIVKRQIQLGSRGGYLALEQVGKKWADISEGTIDYTDGLRVDFEDGWIHARASRTEQLVRVISESESRLVAEERAEKAIRDIELLV